MKKKIIIYTILTVLLNVSYAQIMGKKYKENFLAIDKFSYSVGDVIEVGYPSKGNDYQTIIRYTYKSFLEKTNETLNALYDENATPVKYLKLADKSVSKVKAPIKYFKIKKNKDGSILNFAIVTLNETEELAIEINSALSTGEMISKDLSFKAAMESSRKEGENDLAQLKSFSPSFDVKLISAKGSIETQKVIISLLVKHEIVHQEICLNYREKDAKIYDFEGNEYLAKSAFVGALSNEGGGFLGGATCNKIPTNVPVKCGIVFRQILPDKKEMSFMSIKIGFKAQDGGQYEYGVLEISNLKVDWN